MKVNKKMSKRYSIPNSFWYQWYF